MRKQQRQARNVPKKPRGRSIFVFGALAIVVLAGAAWFLYRSVRSGKPNPDQAATYIGGESCAKCHAQEFNAWRGSHHAQAMQVANSSTMLGNFNDAHFAGDGVAADFTNKDGKFYVQTSAADNKPGNFELTYTFGVYPLQQYLVPFPGGRLQSFVLAWDSRNQQQNGQRWFDLYPGQKVAPGDPLHWMGRNQTWNYMCADCHSTDLRKNYDLATDTYKTTWSELDVSCETCHGPGSEHAAWAKKHSQGSYGNGGDGLIVNLHSPSGSWAISESNPDTMHWKGAARSHTEIETCAPCHSPRHPITSQPQAGKPFLDSYVPSVLEEGVYYADGQILEEDYEWGSFIQSKMYRNGVTCSDCHDPHTAKLRSENLNAVCERCHLAAKFGSEQHHHHKADTAGALCVNCHMPTRTYMVVDVRRDHSFRVPRPDFSVAYGTPNACTQCHKDKSDKWAAEVVTKWYGPNRRQEPHFVTALDAGRHGLPNAEAALTELISNSGQPGIARATALTLLPEYLTPRGVASVQGALKDEDPLVRVEAVRALEPLPPEDRVRMAVPLLADPVRAVRIEAARLLAGTQPDLLQEAQRSALDHAVAELIDSEMASAERPENHVNLALLYAQMGKTKEAEEQLQTALRLDPRFVPAMVNLADLYRLQQRDDEGEKWLEKAAGVAPDAAEPVYALGLLKVRQKQYQPALALLAQAATMQPANTQYSYVYAVALNSAGQPDKAIAVLEDAHRKRPADRQVLQGLVSFERDKGNLAAAVVYARQLVELAPDDPNAKAMLAQLQARQR